MRASSDLLASGFKLLRVGQWIKNGFVLAPLLFAGEMTNWTSVRATLLACLSFCLLSSSVYTFNDWLDRERDRQHPEKRHRPIAAGEVSGGVVFMFVGALLGGALWIGSLASSRAVLVLEFGYVMVNVAYSLWLRRLVILDVFAISAGFVIRVLVGAYAIPVLASHWLLLCTFLLALFLGFSKRRKELVLLGGDSMNHRPVLALYTTDLITQMNLIVCSATVVCYALYTVAPETIAKFNTDRLVYSVPFVVYGLFRYLFLVHNEGGGGSPAELLLTDRPLLSCVVLWVAYCSTIIYMSGGARIR